MALVALLLTTLVAVAVASRSYRPLGTGGSEADAGPSPEFFDYAFTVLLVVLALWTPIALYIFAAYFFRGGDVRSQRRGRGGLRIGLAGLLTVIGVILVFTSTDVGRRVIDRAGVKPQQPPAAKTGNSPGRSREPEFVWPAAFVAGGLLLGGGALAAYYVARTQRRPARAALTLAEDLSEALDDTLDDLRNEADPRRAVIAAYARMERLFAAHELGRHPAEAPLEFLERVLLELDVDPAPIATLTRFFELAKFSTHPIDTATKDSAIAALVEIRDELRGRS